MTPRQRGGGKKYYRRPKVLGKCRICGNDAFGRHHIIPLSRGGDDSDMNRTLLCERCHDIAEEMTDDGNFLSPRAMDIIRLKVMENGVQYQV